MLGAIFLGLFESIGPNLILQGLGIVGANQLKDAIAMVMLVLDRKSTRRNSSHG